MSDDGISADILGLFFGQYNTADGETAPGTDLTIKKSDLLGLGSERTIVGRYTWKNTTALLQELVTKVTLDGVQLPNQNMNIRLSAATSGSLDAPVLKYPNTANALTTGVKHVLKITPGLHKGTLAGPGTFSVSWPETQWFPEKTFTITLV
jgi:hypothetical protein